MRKLFAVVIVVLLSLTFCFAFAACGASSGNDGSNYDDAIKNLQDRVEQLEQENADLQEQITSLPPADNATLKTYGLGETFTYISGGVPLFSITIKELDIIDPKRYEVIFTNINLPSTTAGSMVKICYRNTDFVDSHTLTSTLVNTGKTFKTAMLRSNNPGETYYHVGFPTSEYIIPYATFLLPQ